MDNIKKVFKNVNLGDEFYLGEGSFSETPNEKGDFTSGISARCIGSNIFEQLYCELLDNKEIEKGINEKETELSTDDFEGQISLVSVNPIKIKFGDDGEHIIDLELEFEVC